MTEESYEFDPTDLDENEENQENEGTEDEFETIDNWKPSEKKKKLVTSEWRKNKVGNDFNQEPDFDDVKKIRMHLKKGHPDFEVMQHFGVSAEVLAAIKKNKYCAGEGILLDNFDKIFKEITAMKRETTHTKKSIDFIVKKIFIEPEQMAEYKKFVSKFRERKEKDSKAKDSTDE